MKHLFVPYEIAVMAKNAGFNEPCLAFYGGSKGNIDLYHVSPMGANDDLLKKINNAVLAPLYQQLQDWFRGNHGIVVSVDYFDSGNSGYLDACSGAIRVIKPFKYIEGIGGMNNNYYEAYNAALIEAFKLIKK